MRDECQPGSNAGAVREGGGERVSEQLQRETQPWETQQWEGESKAVVHCEMAMCPGGLTHSVHRALSAVGQTLLLVVMYARRKTWPPQTLPMESDHSADVASRQLFVGSHILAKDEATS